MEVIEVEEDMEEEQEVEEEMEAVYITMCLTSMGAGHIVYVQSYAGT